MTVLIVKRLAWGIVVLGIVSTLTFAATVVSPVDPVEVYAGRFATAEVRAEVRKEFGLDRPAPVRYAYYMKEVLQGNLGNSITNGRPVAESLGERLPATAMLALAGVLTELLIGLPLGILAALKRGSLLDRAILFFSLGGALAPVFVVGFLLLYLFAFLIPIFPIGGYGSLESLFLPALTLGLAGAPWFARMMRSTLMDAMNQEHVRAARARGASERRIVMRHMLPNALNPVVTMLGIDAGVFFAGVLVVEKVFAWPGVGQQAWLAVSQNDFPMIMGAVLFAATAIVSFNLLADLVNMALDPRVRRR